MAGGTVDNWVVGHVLTVVDHNGPEVDEGEQDQVGDLVKRQDHWVDVVGQGLEVTVDWVEGMGGEWSADQPLVVRLVQGLVDTRPVQPSVSQVDTTVGEEDESGVLDQQFP